MFQAVIIFIMTLKMNGIINNEVSFSNPVKDFLALEKIEVTNWFDEKESTVLLDDSEKGFVDFLADIENNMMELQQSVQDMQAAMQVLNEGIADSQRDIDKANKNGGASAIFVRKQTKKVAEHIDSFSRNFKNKTKNISCLWNEIEKSTLGLLENKFSSNEANKESLVNYLKSLYKMKLAVSGNISSMNGLKTSMNSVIGMERSLNQAVRFVTEDISSYITICEQIINSVEKILGKGKFIVGDIDYSTVHIE